MSTKFHIVSNYCTHCKRGDKEILGKRFSNKKFTFNTTDECKTHNDWITKIVNSKAKIFNEYNTEYSLDEFEEMILGFSLYSSRRYLCYGKENSSIRTDGIFDYQKVI